jgi:LCP family protein required for cell wall assembly
MNTALNPTPEDGRPSRPRSVDGPVRQVKKVSTAPFGSATGVAAATVAPTAAASKPTFEYSKRKATTSRKNTKLWVKRIAIALAVIAALAVLYFGGKVLLAARHIISRNTGNGAPALAGEIDPTKLKGEGDGRINILMLGIGGPGHDGPYLSDTIMIMSIDPKTKDVAMLSVPRDLWVQIPGYGSAKVNAACAYGESEHYTGGCGALAKDTLSKILDIPIHYYIRVDFSAFRQAVDSVGGVDVNVEKALITRMTVRTANTRRSSFRLVCNT